jgi:hypothetical protein
MVYPSVAICHKVIKMGQLPTFRYSREGSGETLTDIS